MNPNDLLPMLATAGRLPVDSAGWAYEVKWDGMRAIAIRHRGQTRLRSRTGNDVTASYPELAELAAGAEADGDEPVVIDGEIVMFDDHGRPSFHALQHRMHVGDPSTARQLSLDRPVMFVAFDVVWTGAGPCTTSSYDDRRALLIDLVEPTARLAVPPAQVGDPGDLIELCRERRLEGLVAKRRDSVYLPGRRTTAWIKSKFERSQEFVVIGWTEGSGGRARHFGALLLGYHDGRGELVFAGKVGTGFHDSDLAALTAELAGRERHETVAEVPSSRDAVHWVDPAVVVEVAFSEWSPAGRLRHPAYRGRRADIDPSKVVREPD